MLFLCVEAFKKLKDFVAYSQYTNYKTNIKQFHQIMKLSYFYC